MTGAQFLNAVAWARSPQGRWCRPSPSSATRRGRGGGLFAALVAFTPSFLFVLLGGPHFDRIRADAAVKAFLSGAGPAVIGAIAGSAIPLGLALAAPVAGPVLARRSALALRAPPWRGERSAHRRIGRRRHRSSRCPRLTRGVHGLTFISF